MCKPVPASLFFFVLFFFFCTALLCDLISPVDWQWVLFCEMFKRPSTSNLYWDLKAICFVYSVDPSARYPTAAMPSVTIFTRCDPRYSSLPLKLVASSGQPVYVVKNRCEGLAGVVRDVVLRWGWSINQKWMWCFYEVSEEAVFWHRQAGTSGLWWHK